MHTHARPWISTQCRRRASQLSWARAGLPPAPRHGDPSRSACATFPLLLVGPHGMTRERGREQPRRGGHRQRCLEGLGKEADALASAGLPLSIWGKKKALFLWLFFFSLLPLKQNKRISPLNGCLFALAFSSLRFRAHLSPVLKPCNCAMRGKSQGRVRLRHVMYWGLSYMLQDADAGRERGSAAVSTAGESLMVQTCLWDSLGQGLAVNGFLPLLLNHPPAPAAWSTCH